MFMPVLGQQIRVGFDDEYLNSNNTIREFIEMDSDGFYVCWDELRMSKNHWECAEPWYEPQSEGTSSPLSTQEGGNHYKDMAIQPVEYITKNKMTFIEGSIIKYISRHRAKNGKQDLEKAKHFIDLLIDLEYE